MSFFSLTTQYLRGKTCGQLIIQLTDRCNAHCPQCSMRLSNGFTRSTLDIRRCRKMIDRAVERGVAALSFTGGEPLLYPRELAGLIRHAGRSGIRLTRTGTNGYFLRDPDHPDFSDRVKRMVSLLADTPLRNFWISIDSANATIHERMRGFRGMIRGIEIALPEFHQLGLYPTANLGINRNLGGKSDSMMVLGIVPSSPEEEHQYREEVKADLRCFLARVIDLGFSLVNFCYPMSVSTDDQGLEAVYPATATDRIVRFTRKEKALIFTALLEVIPEYRHIIRIFTPLSALHTMRSVYSGEDVTPFPCRGGVDYFFVNAADGHAYPCGYRGMDDLGEYGARRSLVRSELECTRCDWECFRDPSELLGPLSLGLCNPLSLFRQYRRSSEFYSHWRRDLLYYRACDFFDGRKDKAVSKLDRFRPAAQGVGSLHETERAIRPVDLPAGS